LAAPLFLFLLSPPFSDGREGCIGDGNIQGRRRGRIIRIFSVTAS
jgi:hypothetical protein